MQINMADSKLIVLFHPYEKKSSSSASLRVRGARRFSEALAKCKPEDDIVAGRDFQGLLKEHQQLLSNYKNLLNKYSAVCAQFSVEQKMEETKTV